MISEFRPDLQKFLKSKMMAAREAASISRPQMSRLIGVNPTTIFNWESGKSLPSIEQLIIFAQYTHVCPSVFMPTLKEVKISWL